MLSCGNCGLGCVGSRTPAPSGGGEGPTRSGSSTDATQRAPIANAWNAGAQARLSRSSRRPAATSKATDIRVMTWRPKIIVSAISRSDRQGLVHLDRKDDLRFAKLKGTTRGPACKRQKHVVVVAFKATHSAVDGRQSV
jgi:hypothetical protein